MALHQSLRMVPGQRLITVSIDEILTAKPLHEDEKPQLEQYFSPSRREQFIKDYRHYLNSSLLDVRHGKLSQDLYLSFVLSFQFVAPLLEIPVHREFELFKQILDERYRLEDPDLNLHFSPDDYESGMIGEEDVLEAFRDELEESYSGRRDIKETVQKRLKQDGITAIMKWQQKKGLPQLAEAFGRSIVIPAFFSFTDKKLVDFYRRTTEGISYEVMVPELISGEAEDQGLI